MAKCKYAVHWFDLDDVKFTDYVTAESEAEAESISKKKFTARGKWPAQVCKATKCEGGN